MILALCSLLLVYPIECRVIKVKRSIASSPPDPTRPPDTTAGPTPYTPIPRQGCFYEGKWHPPNSEISSGKDEEQGWCYGLYCDHMGQIVAWDDFHCGPSTTTPPTTLPPTTAPTTVPPGCLHQGKWYPQGKEISRGSDGTGWCYGAFCDEDGDVIMWDDFDCGPSTTPPPTTLPPTTAPTTMPPGCLHQGKWYSPGVEIYRKSNGNGWCYGAVCGAHGQVQPWDDWNCAEKQDPTTPTPTPPLTGCYYGGKWFPEGDQIYSGSDAQGWCYGATCDKAGHVVYWDNHNCAANQMLHTLKPKTPPSTPLGCSYRGKWYPAGADIYRGYNDGQCYGTNCDKNGKVQLWESSSCTLGPTASPAQVTPLFFSPNSLSNADFLQPAIDPYCKYGGC